jgi:hypothetical protein
MRSTGRTTLTALLVIASSAGATALANAAEDYRTSYFSFFDGWEGEPYALDAEPRFLGDDERVECAPSQMVRHRSRALRYVVTVHPEFAVRLQRFEALVTDLALEHYGRAPRKLVHKGAFACRSLRARRDRISEHALGNAIDVQGFDFGPMGRGSSPPVAMPRALRRAFSVRVSQHWSPRSARHEYHAAFLHRLAEELRVRPDIFRGVVGPPRPRHRDHLHLDAAPWRYAMFGYD